MMKLDQVLLIDKPAGITSFGVVARVRRQLSEQVGHKVKVGHAGTLDPFATGLMVILTGKMTKQASEYTKLDKVYQATIRLGETSTTGDPEGVIASSSPSVIASAAKQSSNELLTTGSRRLRPRDDEGTMTAPDQKTVEKVLKTFLGEITQTPPIYSAIKINGQRAYKLARQGKTPEMPARKVTIYEIELIKYNYPDLIIRAHCSSGTYIRTLAEDIGAKLGLGAYTTALRRLKIGDFKIEDAQTISI
jgi:tRNA pseudouridine55 synthase